MKILLAASEAVPFCKTGGLADVVGALAIALKKKNHDVRLVLPRYRQLNAAKFPLRPLGLPLLIPIGDEIETVSLWEAKLPHDVPVYFIDAPKYFNRDGYYVGPDGKDFPDNDERFVLFCRAALEACKAVDFRPDVIHAHDWQAGLISAYLETTYKTDAFFIPTATVFTIHNISYQGIFPKNTLFTAGFPWSEFTPQKMEFYDKVNFLKAGLIYSKLINTVSPRYAIETQTDAQFGGGMEGILKLRTKDYFGVLNGIDGDVWSPETDAALAKNFSHEDKAGRLACKLDLEKAAGFHPDPKTPVVGIVSRLDPQKGIDWVVRMIPFFVEQGATFVCLGRGREEERLALESLYARYPRRVYYAPQFDETMARRIYGGSDIFLMPSRFEPCGLSQMIALRYGAVPVVTPTGGLLDTIKPHRPGDNQSTGFVAPDLSEVGVKKALTEALQAYRRSAAEWDLLQTRGMTVDFSWDRSVNDYIKLYALSHVRKTNPQ